MKIIVDRKKFNFNPEQFLRKNGYGFIVDRRRGKESFVNRLGSGHYPRFHAYVEREEDRLIIDLHLDQKEASYKGSHMHNAEYGGEQVKNEIDRLKLLLREEHRKLKS